MKLIQTTYLRSLIPLLALTLCTSSAFADTDESESQQSLDQSKSQQSSQSKQSAKQSSLREVSGTIAKIKQVEVRGTDVKNTVVMLDTKKNNRRLIVDLGPTKELKSEQLKVGNQIEAEGQAFQVKDHKILVATRFRDSSGKTVMINRQDQSSQHQKKNKQQAGETGKSESSEGTSKSEVDSE